MHRPFMVMRATTPSQLYEADFYAWTKQQAIELRRLAKTRPNLPLDLAHIAEEIQDLGKSEYRGRIQSGATDHRTSAADRAFARDGSAAALVRRDRRVP